MRVEHDAARAEHEVTESERKAPNDRTRTDHKGALSEKLHLTSEVFDLQLLLIMEEKGKRSRGPGGEPWVAGSRPESGRPIHTALQSRAAVGSAHVPNLAGTDEDDDQSLSAKSAQKMKCVSPVVERVELSWHSSFRDHLQGARGQWSCTNQINSKAQKCWTQESYPTCRARACWT